MSGEQNSLPIVPVVTAWTTAAGYDPAQEFGITPEDAARYDNLFRQHAIDIANWRMPWLFQALAEAGVRFVGVAPYNFQVALADGQLRHIPELEAHLTLLPWREPGEAAH